MERPHLRITVGRIMILVAIIALALGAFRLRQTRDRFLSTASQHEVESALIIEAAKITEMQILLMEKDPARIDTGALNAMAHRRSRYHRALARKYRLAAGRPWLSVPPDPPEPK